MFCSLNRTVSQAMQWLENRHQLILAAGMDKGTKEIIGVDDPMFVGESTFVNTFVVGLDAQPLEARLVNHIPASFLHSDMPFHFADVTSVKHCDICNSDLFAECANHRCSCSQECQALVGEDTLE